VNDSEFRIDTPFMLPMLEDWPLLFSGPQNGPYEAKPAYDGVAEALEGI